MFNLVSWTTNSKGKKKYKHTTTHLHFDWPRELFWYDWMFKNILFISVISSRTPKCILLHRGNCHHPLSTSYIPILVIYNYIPITLKTEPIKVSLSTNTWQDWRRLYTSPGREWCSLHLFTLQRKINDSANPRLPHHMIQQDNYGQLLPYFSFDNCIIV